ncbi:lipase family protein [Glaciecola sp. XM2]|jgi:hypothetical protein|uniref:lipase family protein n=1 Tax=Glaciecola sp. XM2 TaxID=1914931 RepID=UPI001BDE602A|nr:lipase family protein [Glaciecola sp. XM2]MBT1452445.1 lipase family protein [Glaciecola sp. XM2]
MTDSYFKSLEQQQNAQSILKLSLPTYRQAYSDRTAWVMSVLSELVYIRFNPLFAAQQNGQSPEYIKSYFIQRVATMVDEDRAATLGALIERVAYDNEQERERLDKQLSEFAFTTIKTFDAGGTQAMLVQNEDYMVLVFRGTETDSLRDIKADARANIRKCETQGMIHSGFYDAYQCVRKDIEETLSMPELQDKPLYITGHSLGGALATVATKFTHHKGGLAACYTFGSPRVGNDDWINNIKTPIHRLVNAADCVTMLPPGDVTVTLFSLVAKLIPGAGERLATWLQEKFGGYMHAGNMRYLTNCNPGDFEDVKVLYTVSFFYRIKAMIYKSVIWSKLLSDHSISVYSQKLMVIAFKRNRKNIKE